MALTIRVSTESDLDDVLHVEEQAFGSEQGPEISELVKGLLCDPSARPLVSLLAVHKEQAVGHILFTRARITGSEVLVSAMILAPLAVIPEAQGQGVGGQLISEGLKRLRGSGVDLVFVLGHPGYYPRHGFQPAGALGLEATYPIPDEHADAWMVQELRPDMLSRISGRVICADALDRPEYWHE